MHRGDRGNVKALVIVVVVSTLSFLAASVAAPVAPARTRGAAEELRCKISDTPQVCWDRYAEELREVEEDGSDAPPNADPAVPASERSAESSARIASLKGAVREKVSGVDSGTDAAVSNTKDFLGLLDFVGLVGVGEKQEDGSLSLDFNRLMPDKVKHLGLEVGGSVWLEPELHAPLVASFSEETRAETKETLDERFGDRTDFKLTASLNLLSKWFGREVKVWREEFAGLFGKALDHAKESPPPPSLANVLHELPFTQGPGEDADLNQTFEAMAGSGGDALRMLTMFERAVLAEVRLEKAIDAAEEFYGLDHLADLLANQPQLFISAEKRFRDELVGAEEARYKLTLEWPLAPSLSKARAACPSEDITALELVAGSEVSCFGNYVRTTNEQAQDARGRGFRLSGSIEYVDVDDLHVAIPDLSIDQTFDGGRKLVASFGWGRRLELDDDGEARSQIDLKAAFEDIELGEEYVDERWLVTLTVSRKVRGVMVPLSIVYADKSEFLAEQDLDEQISAHIGIKLDLNGKEKKSP
jgi:hypothetical protein